MAHRTPPGHHEGLDRLPAGCDQGRLEDKNIHSYTLWHCFATHLLEEAPTCARSRSCLGIAISETPPSITGYAVTSHSAQGLTAERVLVHADAAVHPDLLNSRFGYVSISRGSHDATIFTNDAAKLGQQLGSEITKSSALEIGQASAIGIGQGLGIECAGMKPFFLATASKSGFARKTRAFWALR